MISQSRSPLSLARLLPAGALLTLLTVGPVPAAVVTYTDQAAFLAAAQAIPNTVTELEPFDSGGLTAPDLSVKTWTDWPGHFGDPGYGHIQSGVWSDCVGKDCDTVTDSYTKWQFAKPAYAFGATFDYEGWENASGAVGISFNREIGDHFADLPLQNGFFGFVSTDPLSALTVTQNAWRIFPPDLPYWAVYQEQPYTMDNLYIQVDPPSSDAPEPGTMGLAAIAGLGLLITNRRRNG